MGTRVNIDNDGNSVRGAPLSNAAYSLTSITDFHTRLHTYVVYQGSRTEILPPGPPVTGSVLGVQVISDGIAVGSVISNSGHEANRAFTFTLGTAQGNQATLIPLMASFYLPAPDPATLANVPAWNEALGVNKLGQVVGASGNNFGSYAFIYSDGISSNWNALIAPSSGLVLTSAVSINDLGQITGYAKDANNNIHEYLLNPSAVPEPRSIIMYMIAIVSMLLVLGKS